MKKVKVKVFDTDIYGYTFYLRGQKQSFTSQRSMTEFVNLLNKKLTDNTAILNQLYIELYIKYREQYFILSNFEHAILKDRFGEAETYIENIISRTKGTNGMHIAVNCIDKSINTFSEIISVMMHINKKRSDTSMIYYLKTKKEFLNFFEAETQEMKIQNQIKTETQTKKAFKHA